MYEFFSLSDQRAGHIENGSAILECVALNLCALVVDASGQEGGRASQLALQKVEDSVRSGGGLIAAVKAAALSVEETCHLQDDKVSILACCLGREGFELAWTGSNKAYLFDGLKTQLLTQKVASPAKGGGSVQFSLNSGAGDIPSGSGVLEDGDTLLLCGGRANTDLSVEQLNAVFVENVDIEVIGNGVMDLAKASEPDEGFSAILVRKELDSELDTEEVVFRSPFDRSRYADNTRGRPVFLLLLLISIVFILFVL